MNLYGHLNGSNSIDERKKEDEKEEEENNGTIFVHFRHMNKQYIESIIMLWLEILHLKLTHSPNN